MTDVSSKCEVSFREAQEVEMVWWRRGNSPHSLINPMFNKAFFFRAGQLWKELKDMISCRRKSKRGKKRENTMNTKKQPEFVPINQKWQVCLYLVCILNVTVFWIAKPTCNWIPFYLLCSMTRLLNTHDQNELFVCGTDTVSYFFQ